MTAIKSINLIPSDYDGNPRDASGYAWQNCEKKEPGYDVYMPAGQTVHDAILGIIKKYSDEKIHAVLTIKGMRNRGKLWRWLLLQLRIVLLWRL
jgi:hypothetical protein